MEMRWIGRDARVDPVRKGTPFPSGPPGDQSLGYKITPDEIRLHLNGRRLVSLGNFPVQSPRLIPTTTKTTFCRRVLMEKPVQNRFADMFL